MYVSVYITNKFSEKLISNLNDIDDFFLNPKSYSEAKNTIDTFIKNEEKFLSQDFLVILFSDEYSEEDTLEFVEWIKAKITPDIMFSGRFDWGFISDNEIFNNKIDSILSIWYENMWNNIPPNWFEKYF